MPNFADRLAQGGFIAVVDPNGNIGTVPESKLEEALSLGYTQAAPEEIEEKQKQDELSGVTGTLKAAGVGALSGLTFGVLPGALTSEITKTVFPFIDEPKETAESLQRLHEAQPEAYMAGEVAGAIAPILLSGGAGGAAKAGTAAAQTGIKAGVKKGIQTVASKMPTTILSRQSLQAEEALTKQFLKWGAGEKLAKALAKTGTQGAEGAAYGAGFAISEDAVGGADHELTAERLLSHMGSGALFGAAIPASLAIGPAAGSLAIKKGWQGTTRLANSINQLALKPFFEATVQAPIRAAVQTAKTGVGMGVGYGVGSGIGAGFGMLAGTGIGGMIGQGGINSMNEVIYGAAGRVLGKVAGGVGGIFAGAKAASLPGVDKWIGKTNVGGLGKLAYSKLSSWGSGVPSEAISRGLAKEGRKVINMSDWELNKFSKQLIKDLEENVSDLANVRNTLDDQYKLLDQADAVAEEERLRQIGNLNQSIEQIDSRVDAFNDLTSTIERQVAPLNEIANDLANARDMMVIPDASRILDSLHTDIIDLTTQATEAQITNMRQKINAFSDYVRTMTDLPGAISQQGNIPLNTPQARREAMQLYNRVRNRTSTLINTVDEFLREKQIAHPVSSDFSQSLREQLRYQQYILTEATGMSGLPQDMPYLSTGVRSRLFDTGEVPELLGVPEVPYWTERQPLRHIEDLSYWRSATLGTVHDANELTMDMLRTVQNTGDRRLLDITKNLRDDIDTAFNSYLDEMENFLDGEGIVKYFDEQGDPFFKLDLDQPLKYPSGAPAKKVGKVAKGFKKVAEWITQAEEDKVVKGFAEFLTDYALSFGIDILLPMGNAAMAEKALVKLWNKITARTGSKIAASLGDRVVELAKQQFRQGTTENVDKVMHWLLQKARDNPTIYSQLNKNISKAVKKAEKNITKYSKSISSETETVATQRALNQELPLQQQLTNSFSTRERMFLDKILKEQGSSLDALLNQQDITVQYQELSQALQNVVSRPLTVHPLKKGALRDRTIALGILDTLNGQINISDRLMQLRASTRNHLNNIDLYGPVARREQEISTAIWSHELSLRKLRDLGGLGLEFDISQEGNIRKFKVKDINKLKKTLSNIGNPDFEDEKILNALQEYQMRSEEFMNSASKVVTETEAVQMAQKAATTKEVINSIKDIRARNQLNVLKNKSPLLAESILLGGLAYIGMGPIGLGLTTLGRSVMNPRFTIKALGLADNAVQTAKSMTISAVEDFFKPFIREFQDTQPGTGVASKIGTTAGRTVKALKESKKIVRRTTVPVALETLRNFSFYEDTVSTGEDALQSTIGPLLEPTREIRRRAKRKTHLLEEYKQFKQAHPELSELQYEYRKKYYQIEKLIQNPEELANRVAGATQGLKVFAPTITDHLSQKGLTALQFLYDKAPKPPMNQVMGQKWNPSKAEILKWTRYLQAVENPLTVVEKAAGGVLEQEGIEVLQTIYPRLYGELRASFLEKMAVMDKLPYQARLRVSRLLNIPLDPLATPDALVRIQSDYLSRAQEKEQPQQPPSRPTNLKLPDSASFTSRIANR